MAVHYDELWKNIIEKLFPYFLSFFMPELSADVDLSQGYEFMDKELQRIKLKGKKGKKYTDKLVKVRLKDGTEKWLLIHIEVQGKHEEDFGQRMFKYFYRIYDKHDVDITALAVLTYKTDQQYDFNYDVYGASVSYRYNTACIANYPEAELQKNQNPFALICLAVQYDNRYRADEDKKFNLKRDMIKMLRDRGYKKEEIIELLEFIDDAIQLTDTMKNKIFDEEVMHLLEEDEPMAYVSGFRQRAINEGKLEGKREGELKGLMEGLMGMIEIKFGSVPSEFQKKMHEISELSKLEMLKEGIKRATDFEQVQKLL
jgi:hypothetical protein